MELESEVNMWLHVSVMAPGFISNVVLFFIQMGTESEGCSG